MVQFVSGKLGDIVLGYDNIKTYTVSILLKKKSFKCLFWILFYFYDNLVGDKDKIKLLSFSSIIWLINMFILLWRQSFVWDKYVIAWVCIYY